MCHRTPEQLRNDGHEQLANEAESGALIEGSVDFEEAAKLCAGIPSKEPPVVAAE